jgi:hypothetical protein|tara:strand:- start:507 stop:626 length:120 start_codon:yes stop_codon:yes gene_type:complete
MMNLFKKFLQKILNYDELDLRIRRLERKNYWREKYNGRS